MLSRSARLHQNCQVGRESREHPSQPIVSFHRQVNWSPPRMWLLSDHLPSDWRLWHPGSQHQPLGRVKSGAICSPAPKFFWHTRHRLLGTPGWAHLYQVPIFFFNTSLLTPRLHQAYNAPSSSNSWQLNSLGSMVAFCRTLTCPPGGRKAMDHRRILAQGTTHYTC